MIKRPLPIIGCAYLLSLAVVFLLSSLHGIAMGRSVYLILAAAAPAVAGIVCAVLRPSRNVLRVVALAAAAFALGVVHTGYRTITIPARVSVLYEQKAIITARLDDLDGVSGSRYRYVVTTNVIAPYDDDTGHYAVSDVPQTVRMRLTVPAPLDADYGDTLTTVVDITPPYPLANDDPYVVRDADGVMAFCYAYGDIAYQIPAYYPPLARLRTLRDAMRTGIQKAVGGDAGLVAASMLTGDKSAVPTDILEAFRNAGLSHLLAVSGLHAAILTQFLLMLLAFFRCPRKAGGIVCMAALLVFAAFTGFTASIVRASVMASALFAARLFDRRYDGINSITLAALILCVASPAALLSVGFMLSFTATLSILLLAPSLNALCERYAPWLWRHAGWAVQAATLSLSATLFTYPITAAVFGRVSLIGPVTNILVLPLIPLMLIATLLTGIAGLAGAGVVTQALGLGARTITLIVLRIVRFFGSLDFAAARAGVFVVCLTGALCVLCAVAVRLFRRRVRHTGALACLAVLLVCAGASFELLRTHDTEIVIAIPDSDRSQTAVLHQDGRAVLLAGMDTKGGAGSAAYYINQSGTDGVSLLLAPCLNDAAAAVVRETLQRVDVEAAAIADDTIRYKELLAMTNGGGVIPSGVISEYTLLDGAHAYVDKRRKGSAAVFVTANGVTVLFVYGGIDAARLPQAFLTPEVCVVSGALPENFGAIRARYYSTREGLPDKNAAAFAGKTILSADGDTPLLVHCAEGGKLRLEGPTLDVYR